ncbi:glycosyltransferase family 4 protein [Cellulophaga baltica]|uniref:glycosyltransferase n=1 Tax=Cellulophaga TaxID=104264 RepID=UPI001C07EE44|nr:MULTISPECIES: glycosyltransferase [Cellulophaga]MBU2996238.1 glycosyltransferase family 4 protein [Cellulophaga baltica]MDO6767633.1 glycosyltransferase [Cellulophaga sp. 1_MG-2023]
MQKVLFIGVNWPEPSTAAGSRIMQLIKVFITNEFQVTFSSTATTSNLSFDLEKLGVSMVPIQLNDAGFDVFIKELQPTIVVYDRFLTEEQFGWRVAENVPNALRILDTEDLHSLRTVRADLYKKNIPFSTAIWLQSDVAKREIASIYRCDISLIISSVEMQLLQKHVQLDSSLLLHLPFMEKSISEVENNELSTYDTRKDFICIGNGKHAPNVDAVLWLKKTIWPLIRKQLSTVNLHIYGSYLPQQIMQMHKPTEGFYVEGFADNLKETFTAARINLAPLRFGAGLKGKLLDGMRFGTPSITTLIGAEGMSKTTYFDEFAFGNEVDFANKAVQIYTDEIAYKKAQQVGFKVVNTEYNRTFLAEKLINTINKVQNNLQMHRNSNFIGSLLMHQSMQSTKYMSRWIEAKNK